MSRPVVLKFGGSTFRGASYRQLAASLSARIEADGGPLAIVVSAMPGETERLRERLHEVNPHPADASVAGLLTLADTVSAHLLSAALQQAGCRSTVLVGHQLGFTTSDSFMWARLRDTDPAALLRALAEHETVIIPGGQAVDAAGRPTWLGKNSSDLSAVAAAAAIGADTCEIYSDVEGIYSADPNLVTGARLLPEVSYDTATLMSQHGAKVLHRGAVHLAERHGITIVCRLNRAPFQIGSTISGSDAQPDAVILNRNSVVLGYADEADADRAHQALRSQGVETIRFDDGPRVAVIGGYLDLEKFERQHSLPSAKIQGIPVAELKGGRVRIQVARGEEEAVTLAQDLHDALTTPAPISLSSV